MGFYDLTVPRGMLESQAQYITAPIALHASFTNNLVVVVLRLVLFNMCIYTVYKYR